MTKTIAPVVTAADVAAEDAAGNRTCEGTALAAAFDFNRADRGDASGLDRLGAAGFATRIRIAGKAVLRAGAEEKGGS
jgi:hypothetical protein